MAFVLDASSALPWCFVDEATPFSAALQRQMASGHEAIVPAHWPTEVLSALLRGKRRRRIDDAGVQAFLENLESFSIQIEPSLPLRDLNELKHLSERLELNAYDAVYLSLAKSRGIALATADDALLRAALVEGVPLVRDLGDFPRPETTPRRSEK